MTIRRGFPASQFIMWRAVSGDHLGVHIGICTPRLSACASLRHASWRWCEVMECTEKKNSEQVCSCVSRYDDDALN